MLGCLNPGGQRGFPLSSTAQHTLTLICPDVRRMPASGREGCGSPPAAGNHRYTLLHVQVYVHVHVHVHVGVYSVCMYVNACTCKCTIHVAIFIRVDN